MLYQKYSDADLVHLTDKARKIWEYDLTSTPKRIKRREYSNSDSIPIQAIYRMAVEDWEKGEFNCYYFPFTSSSFARVIGLNEGWYISVEDRKYLEKDFILFDSDGSTILVLPEKEPRWWETTWFNIVSLTVGVLGLVIGLTSM